ncbi:hypothetical protein [Halarsenatibacter silvermanii]|uniref:Glutamate synthase domain-containing protein 3 n=1 Tax=Halarsenatibacter silvermanii TaxID=321763 RepID=A0A1G9R077_9FIRM|nr:hypothetical protein [Halarsenatibacter silvermanii]SDM16634.1 Glutamate synthase domain-containing protein 3 [Halarsenatibacter silvermanii]
MTAKSSTTQRGETAVIDADGVYYQDLNRRIREITADGIERVILKNVNGQRYIGDGLNHDAHLRVEGTPGNDMAAFAENIEIEVIGNAQDAAANTMGGGRIIIHGAAGDILGYSMRGGEVYVRGRAGYRAGIHMKGFEEKQPNIVIGGKAGDFLAEYMAGGRLVVLGLDCEGEIVGDHVGAGMHGGRLFIRGGVQKYKLGREVKITGVDAEAREELREILSDYARVFDLNLDEIMSEEFSLITPVSHRPYGDLYVD